MCIYMGVRKFGQFIYPNQKIGPFIYFLFKKGSYNFQKNIVLFSLKIDFVLANSAEHGEMLHNAAFHLGLHCLPKYSILGFLVFMGLICIERVKMILLKS